MLALSCISITSIIRLFFAFDERRYYYIAEKFTHKNFCRSPSKIKVFRLNNFKLKVLRGEFFQNYGNIYVRIIIYNLLHLFFILYKYFLKLSTYFSVAILMVNITNEKQVLYMLNSSTYCTRMTNAIFYTQGSHISQ